MKALFAIFALIVSVSLSFVAQAASELIDQDPIAVPAKLIGRTLLQFFFFNFRGAAGAAGWRCGQFYRPHLLVRCLPCP